MTLSCKKKIQGASGFTLVELMVVIILGSMVLSIEAPQFFKRIEKIKNQAEEKKLTAILHDIGMFSFLRRSRFILSLKGQTLFIESGKNNRFDSKRVVGFTHIDFETTRIAFDENGFSDSRRLVYYVGGKEKTIDL